MSNSNTDWCQKMINSTIKKMIALCILAIIFVVITYNNSRIKDIYPSLSEINYTVQMFEQKEDIAFFNFDHTTLARDEELYEDKFDDCYYALLINDTDKEFCVAKNIYDRMYPASMTKVMTAIIVAEKLEAGEISLDDMVEIKTYYDLTYEGVIASDLFPGYKISLKNLLSGLLIESNNYYALYLAEYIAGDVNSFCKLMNEKAKEIGATNTHFVNPHGLDDPNHYSCPYDIYLITKEAYTHDVIKQIDEFANYTYVYYTDEGIEVDADIEATNYFKTGQAVLPSNYTMNVWKTGTTDAAGYCLTMYLEKDGKSYIMVASSWESKYTLYSAIVRMLCLIE